MTVEYRRDLAHNYMLIREETEEFRDTYELRILMSNRISGLLPIEIEQVNGVTVYRYDITSCQPFHAFCAGGRITADVLRSLYENLLDALLSFEDYLLDSRHLLLDPEYLFLRWEEKALQIPYVPFHEKDVRESLIALTEAILMQISNGLEESIVLACRILHELQGKDVQLADVRRFLEEDRISSASGERPRESGVPGAGAYGAGSYAGAPAREDAYERIRRGESRGPEERRPGEFRDIPGYGMQPPKTGPGTGPEAEPGIFYETGESGRMKDTAKDAAKRAKKVKLEPALKREPKGKGETQRKAAALEKVKEQVPERAAVRAAALAAVPAGIIFLVLRMQEFFLLSTEEMIGTSILTAVLFYLLLRLAGRRKKAGKHGASDAAERQLLYAGYENAGYGNAGYEPDFESTQGGSKEPLHDARQSQKADPDNRPEVDAFLPLYARASLKAAGQEAECGSSATERDEETPFRDLYLQPAGPATGEEPNDERTVLLAEQREVETARAALVPVRQGNGFVPIPVQGREILIGKQKNLADAVIPDDTISRVHARIVRRGSVYYLSDMGSRNGTTVNGNPVIGREEVPLTEGAQVSFADCRYVYHGS